MCIRAGSNELESVKNLMGMSLMAIVAESLDRDIEEIEETSHLVNDLGMTHDSRMQLEELVADVFDGFRVNLNTTPTVGSLLDKVVHNEFADPNVRQYVGLDALTVVA